MNKTSNAALIPAILLSLLIGGVIGFFVGVASIKAGQEFLEGLYSISEKAKVASPQKINRDRFGILYPSNWKIDTSDEDYNADELFSIESPGGSYVTFSISKLKLDPEESVQSEIDIYKTLMSGMTIERFENYGKYSGKGAILKGKFLGTKQTIIIFSCYTGGLSVTVEQQYLDDDLKYVKPGIDIIESSFTLKAGTEEKVEEEEEIVEEESYSIPEDKTELLKNSGKK